MNILLIVAIFLFLLSTFCFICAYVAMTGPLYKRFFTWWLTFFGVPANMQAQMPMEMYIRQAKIASWLFVFLGILTAGTGCFMLYL